ncbi:hypothetical protein FBR02_16985 [Anaerolineae bacterium CFX9]|nr:hypothetical protein [Anaerolineae bacterium CFX9]
MILIALFTSTVLITHSISAQADPNSGINDPPYIRRAGPQNTPIHTLAHRHSLAKTRFLWLGAQSSAPHIIDSRKIQPRFGGKFSS